MKTDKTSVVWITGASSGIGEALVHAYAATGCRVILSSRNKDKLEEIKSGFENPERLAVLPLDLSRPEKLSETADRAIQLFGHVDLLINNGGISQRSLASETSIDVDRKLMEVNYFGNIMLTKCLLPHFISRNSGHIAVVSSLVGKFGSPYRSGYAASKHALHGYYDSLRAELADTGIRITIICPGFIRTEVSVNALTEDGSPLHKMDDAQANGMDPSLCAQKIIKAIQKNKREVYIGGKEVLGVYVKRFFPDLFASILPRARVR
ncbi:MAG: SDR family oxidoreductase [Cyclobacteriaceae bacterium]